MAKKKNKETFEIMLHAFSNEPNEHKLQMLQLFYQAASMNQIGYMDALNAKTGKVEKILVGMEPTGDGNVRTYPLARIIDKEEVADYLPPNGKGAYGDGE